MTRSPTRLTTHRMHDLTGQCFGRLTVIERRFDGKSNTRWRCLCNCGNETTATTGNLLGGKHKSCGCYRKESVERTFQSGYAFLKIPTHPRANPYTGRVREHIVVMEDILGRYLLPGEEAHHKNTIRSDNRPENLELWIISQPSGGRVEDMVAWAREILNLYALPTVATIQ